MRLIMSILLLLLVSGCQATNSPVIEMDVNLGSFGTKHISTPVTIEMLDNNTSKLTFSIEEHFSFHAGYKVTVVSNESFTGKITKNTSGKSQFDASKEIEYWIHTVDSVNAKTSSSIKAFATITGDINNGKFKLTYKKQP